jgi:hypothetical protein
VTVPTARKVLATLHSVLEHAISQDWIATNAARGTKVIGPRGEGSKKIEPPSKEDMRRVIEAAPEGLRLMLIFAASTGYARASNGRPVGVTLTSSSTSYASAVGSMSMARRVHLRASRACGHCPCLTSSWRC